MTPDKNKVLIVANYRSGLGWYKGMRVALAARRLRRLLRRSGRESRFLALKRQERIEDLVEREIADYGTVVGIFGDGSIRGMANGLARSGALDRVFLPLPYGTGNDFCQELRISANVLTSFERLANVRQVDLGWIRHDGKGAFFTSTAGVGMPPMVSRIIQESKQRNRDEFLYYYYQAVRTFFEDFEPPSLKVTAWCGGDQLTRTGRFHALIIGNTGQYAGHFRLFPQASIVDGRLDVCLVHAMRKRTLAVKFPLVYVGLHTRVSGIEAFQCERLLIEGEAELEIDGDYFGRASEVELRIAREKLTVGGLPPSP